MLIKYFKADLRHFLATVWDQPELLFLWYISSVQAEAKAAVIYKSVPGAKGKPT